MIVLEAAAYRYPGAATWALPPTTLELGSGEVVGVRGPNESGKTTLCLVASGLAPASVGGELSGQVLVDGEPAARRPLHELAQACGMLFDNPAVQLTGLHRTVFEEVAFGPCNLGLPAAQVREQVATALAQLGAERLAGRDPARLSGGESQLVALAGLLALRPGHLVLDEPTSRLDREHAALVAGAIARLAGTGVGVLIAEHDDQLLSGVCDRVVELAPTWAAPGPEAPALGPRPPAAREVLSLEAVSYRYPDGTPGLDGVSLAVGAGEAVAIVGPTGSGKSTLARHLNGLLRPAAGRVLLDGADIRGQRVANLARRVGIAFQEPDRQLFRRTVAAEVAFGAREPGAVDDALALTGLASVRDRHPYDLGYSRRKLVAIAAVLAMRTAVVVLDEPTTGQDRAGIECLAALMARLRAEGRTVVAVSHDPAFVSRTCDREVRLAAGRVVT